MVSIERAIGLTFIGGVVAALVYKIISTPTTSVSQAQPSPTIGGGIEYVPYPAPYPVVIPTEEDDDGEDIYPTGPTQDESMELAQSYVMSQPPYTTLSCTTPVCTDIDTLRTPFAWNFKFEFTCDPLAVVRVAYVTVVNGIVTNFSVTP